MWVRSCAVGSNGRAAQVASNKYDFYFSETGGCECQAPDAPARLVMGGWPARGTAFESDRVSIGYTRCRPVSEGMGPEIRSGISVLAFPTRGLFRMHINNETHVCDPNIVIFQNATDIFRTSHPGAIGDDTVWLTFREDLVQDAVRALDPGVDERPGSPFPFTVGQLHSRVFVLMRSLFNESQRGPDAEQLLVEETSIELLGDAFATAFEAKGNLSKPSRATTVRAHRDMAEAARGYMAAHLHSRLTIEQIAAQVHCSTYHLCRLFRRQTGMTVHRYLSRLRLRAAVDRLQEHRADLAKLANDLGFASHSHFCDAFRREFGVPPSIMRQRITDLRTLLETID